MFKFRIQRMVPLTVFGAGIEIVNSMWFIVTAQVEFPKKKFFIFYSEFQVIIIIIYQIFQSGGRACINPSRAKYSK